MTYQNYFMSLKAKNKLAIILSIVIISYLGIVACGPQKSAEVPDYAPKREMSVKEKQYYREGQKLYTMYCANCHQEDGSGLGKLIPPLAGSDYMEENFSESICGIKNGFKGEMRVNGIIYNQAMPSKS